MRAKAAVRPEPIPLEPEDSARFAGLRYVHDADPGLRRKRSGRGFTYLGADGSPVRDKLVLRRVRSLVVPPAWTDVWICPSATGHLQASGRDARDRKQYRYHPRWRKVRDETKYGRMVAFGEALLGIRRRVTEALGKPGLTREKVLATVVRLLETTLIRVGNEEYARSNKSYGLTTMRTRHVEVSGSTLRFRFRGKSGKVHDVDVRDRRAANVVKRCQDVPGYELFQYRDDDGVTKTIDAADVNEYLREISDENFTAKDFRTWAGTVLAAGELVRLPACECEADAKRGVVDAVKTVAGRLGNTPAICRGHYIHPALIASYLDRSLVETLETLAKDAPKSKDGFSAEEAVVLSFLKTYDARSAVAEPSRLASGSA